MAGGLNLYGYAGGDPINHHDPFGLTCEKIKGTTAPCELFGAIWAEASGASGGTQSSMAHVIKNRVDGGWGASYKDVIFQKNQFSFTRGTAGEARNMAAYRAAAAGEVKSAGFDEMVQRVESVYSGAEDPTLGATFYYSPRSMGGRTPSWDFSKLIHTQKIHDEFNAYTCKDGKPKC